jgi:hypothetical protein
MDTVAVYFPSYHRDELNDRWYGEGWSEWKLLEQAKPLFPGHKQPKLCTWGSFDEADPLWMEKQIDLAADHGITSFMFDWYWYSGQKFMYRALEDGFLKSRNRNRLKFFVMWANHTWGVMPACREIFRGHIEDGDEDKRNEGQALAYDKPLLEIKHSHQDLIDVAEYCAKNYFHESNYHCIDEKPIFSFWRWEELEKHLGGIEKVAEGFEAMRQVARRHGFPGLHIMVNIACYENDQTVNCWWPSLVERIKQAGADSVYGYNAARTDGYNDVTNDNPVVPYDDVIQSHKELFRLCENKGLPFHPVATVGFDNTPRWHKGASLPIDFRKHHYEPVVIGNTPELFGKVVQECLDSVKRSNSSDSMVLVNAWNEWTEGCHLLPDQHYGNGYLEVLSKKIKEYEAQK